MKKLVQMILLCVHLAPNPPILLPLLQMCNIPFLSKQLDLLLTLRELPISMSDLQPVSLLLHLLKASKSGPFPQAEKV